jgi:hypothetical protein
MARRVAVETADVLNLQLDYISDEKAQLPGSEGVGRQQSRTQQDLQFVHWPPEEVPDDIAQPTRRSTV